MEHIKTVMLGTGTVIVTENADGELYVLTADHVNDIIIDWLETRSYVPANDARVFFAAWNGEPINPYSYTDFESLLDLLRKRLS